MVPYNTYYLAHHGILGQKWGKKNGPPYPLDASDHSASEKKAGWRKSLDKGGKSEDNNKKKSKEIRAPEKKGLTDKQKTALKVGPLWPSPLSRPMAPTSSMSPANLIR